MSIYTDTSTLVYYMYVSDIVLYLLQLICMTQVLTSALLQETLLNIRREATIANTYTTW